MNFKEELKYVGNPDQLIRVNRLSAGDGKAKPSDIIEVFNSSGMSFQVNADRCLDLTLLDYKGINISYISKLGIVAPAYFDDRGLGFLKSFTAGLLTTCGLVYAGAPCEYEGDEYGLHGNISNTPAENVSYNVVYDDEHPYVEIKGKIRDAAMFGHNLCLYRTIKCYYKEPKIILQDVVKNEGFKKQQHMMMYHCNIGYPLLSPSCQIHIRYDDVLPRTEHAKSGRDRIAVAEIADADYQEMCYYYDMTELDNNRSKAGIYNPELGIGIVIDYDNRNLDNFLQWKMMASGNYVMGLEPCNCTIDGISDAISKNMLKYLEPMESVSYELEFKIAGSLEEFDSFIK